MTYSKITTYMISVHVLLVFPLLFLACTESSEISSNNDTSADKEISSSSNTSSNYVDDVEMITLHAKGNANVLEVTTIHDHSTNEHKFELSHDEIPSGWNTLRFNNATDSDHFFLLYEVPNQAIDAAETAGQPLLQHWYESVTVPFQEEFNPYIQGDISYGDFVNNLVGAISASAPWFLDPGATPMGGPGITAAGQTSETTVNLQSGTYIVECYVKDENQEFHSYNGMLDILEVTDESSREKEPKPTMEVSISQNGLDIDESVRPGKHTIAINFGEQPQAGYEHILGHNAQLVRLDDNYDNALLDELAAWMDWTKADGLVYRAPRGATFLGGSMEMIGGSTAYMSVILKPGNYAWIAEVPDPAGKGMLKPFTIPPNSQSRAIEGR